MDDLGRLLKSHLAFKQEGKGKGKTETEGDSFRKVRNMAHMAIET